MDVVTLLIERVGFGLVGILIGFIVSQVASKGVR